MVEIPAATIEACRRGDAQAFESLVRATERQVYSLVYRIVGNHDDAADVAQEVYVKVWRAIRSFRGEALFTSWLHRIAANAAIEHLRKRGRLAEPLDPERLAALERPAPAPDPAVETGDVDDALTRLPAAYRAALVMREIYGFGIEEIAEQMGQTQGAAKVRLHRARMRLAAELQRGATPAAADRPRSLKSSIRKRTS